MINRRFYETNAMFKRRQDLAEAKAMLGKKKLWRVTAVEMQPQDNGGWKMGKMDHFTVGAYSEEMAIGVFKLRNDRMNWFVTNIEPETVSN